MRNSKIFTRKNKNELSYAEQFHLDNIDKEAVIPDGDDYYDMYDEEYYWKKEEE